MKLGTAQVIRANSRHLPLADNSVDLVVTSPPYLNLRAYQDAGQTYDGQIGSEASQTEFLDALLEVTRECMRVLKSTGSIFVNLGDSYRDKGLQFTPERYRIRCADELGLIGRAVVIWSKPNGLPESVTDRVRRSHEDWVHFTLQPRYFSAVDEIREIFDPKYDAWQARYAGQYQYGHGDSLKGQSGGASAFPRNPLGKLPGSVWTVPTEPLRVPDHLGIDHFAAFPTAWPRKIISAWCPEDGTVLDPFGGTGTTAMVAKALGRHGITVDMSADYCRLAEWRTNDRNQLAKVLGVEKTDAPDADQLDLFGGDAA